MGLTRIRAEQISDIDYKQAVRVITLSNITLSGGAPSTVDGVNLAASDRILVAGQSTGSQNGLYYVQSLGTGNNGTWTRTIDGNETGEIEAGMVVMVTEGTTYADSQWKLTTNNPITIGSTALTFEQSSAYAFGIISANGTTISADSVGDTLTISSGTGVRVIGNATNDSITLSANLTELIGGSNYQIQYNNNGVFGGAPKFIYDNSVGRVIANAEIASTSTSTGTFIVQGGAAVTGNLHVGGVVNSAANIAGGNIATSGQLKSTGTFVIGTQQFYAQGSDGFSVNENFNAGNATVTAYHYTSGAGRNGIVFDTAVTGQFTNGFGATGSAAQNKFVSFAEFGNTTWEWRKNVGISAPNLNGGTLLANLNPDGNLYTLGTITASNNINGQNIVGTSGVYGNELYSTQSSGDDGGQLNLAKPATNTAIDGNVVVDVYQSKLRIFEAAGDNRGVYVDLTQANAGVGTNLLAGGGGGTPGGANTYVQFNDSGIFNGDINFTYDKANGTIAARGRNVPTYFTGNTAPTSPAVGDEWYYPVTDVLYKYINDGTSNVWIDISSALYNANTAAIANTIALRDSGANLTATNFIGVASSAKYADLAEKYSSDADYAPGTVVVFGGTQEITVSNISHDTRIAGVISTAPAYLMNSEATGLPVAFTGRVPCFVCGPVSKGDVLVNSNTAGVAQTIRNNYTPGCVIGKSLEAIADDNIHLIEIVVGRF